MGILLITINLLLPIPVHPKYYFNVQVLEIINEIFYNLFYHWSLNPVCILHTQHSSISAPSLSGAQKPPVAGGCRVRQAGLRQRMWAKEIMISS